MEHDGVDDAGGDDVCGEILRQFRRSQAPEHRHLCAISLAIAEILKEQALESSPTACFAAAMSSLERQINTTPRDLAVTTALVTFLARVIDKVPPAVLRSKSDKTLQLLLQVLNADTSVAATVKPGLNCLTTVVKDSDLSNWVSLAKPFHVVLKYCVDQKPKVRKCAHKSVAQMLMAFQRHASFAPASEAVVSSFETTLKAVIGPNLGKTEEKVKVAPGTTGAVEILHMLGAMKLILPAMSGKAIGKVLPVLADLVQLRQRLLTRRILDTMQELCTSRSAEVPVNEYADVLAKLAAYFSAAGKKDVDEVPVATRLIQKGFERLHALDPSACALKLPSVFSSLSGLLAAEQEEIVYGSAECMRNLVLSCVDESLVHQGITRLQQSGELRGPPSAVERMCVTAESLLGYQYSTAWDMALPVVSALFDVLGPASYLLMPGTVKTLGDLQRLPDEDMTCRKQLHKALGAALAAMGPEQFLTLLPLDMDNADLATSRIWLLPILKQYTVGARLGFFADNLLPLASRLRVREQKLIADGKPVAAKNCEACVESIWALLPSVCNYPVDTATDFGRIAKTLGDALNKEAGLRGLICSALQTLILQNRMARGDQLEGKKELKAMEEFNSSESTSVSNARARVADCYTPDAASASLATIAGYSRNFLPLLFNQFLAQPSEKRGDLQATIASIASVSDQQTVKNFFIAIMKKLLQATKDAVKPKDKQDAMQVDTASVDETATSRRCVFMDLALSLIKGLDEEALTMLYETAVPALQDKEGLVQKKAYKIIASICKANEDFLAKKSEEMLEVLVLALESCHASARRHRLDCVQYIIIHYTKFGDQKKDQIIATLISEIILATKEANKKSRNGAYDLLIKIGHAMDDLDSDRTNLMRFFNMILACLAGTTPHMISAAVASLARLIYEFSSDLCHTIPHLLPTALLLLRSKNREIIKSVLGLVKVVIARLPAAELETHLPSMVRGLMLWSDDSKNRFKAKVREIIERIVRRCGMTSVAEVMPAEHMKLLTSIRKKKEQAEKKKRVSTEDDDDAKSSKSRATTARRSAWNHTDVFSDEEDDDSEDELGSTQAPTTTKSASMARTSNTSKSKKLRKSSKRLPEDFMDTGEEPLDLLDVQRTREVLSSVKRKRKGDDDDDEPEFAADGRLIVDENGDKKRKHSRDHDDDGDGDGDDTRSRGGRSAGGATKHGRPVKGGAAQEAGRKRAKKSGSSWAYTGDEYVNHKGKGGGDVKKEGKLDPYAYWPLDPKMLNRRQAKRTAARDGMSSVFKAGSKRKGAGASAKPSLVKRGANKKHHGSKSKHK
ncbi:ribosomal RNA-processing protein 12 [Marchantia polymorpha subsp. ruderalis]